MTLATDDRPFALAPTACVVVEVPGDPVAVNSHKFGRGHVYKQQKARAYQTQVQYLARLAMRGRTQLSGPVRVHISAAVPIPKSWSAKKKTAAMNKLIWPTNVPDGDNYQKLAWDGVKAIVFRDDAQIVKWSGEKFFSPEPRLRIEVEAML